MHTAGFWWGNMIESDNLEDPSADGRIILKKKWDWGAWTKLMLLRVGTSLL